LRLSIEYSFPLWLVRRWHGRFGLEGVTALLGLLDRSPEFGLRVDSGRITKAAAKQRLADLGVEVQDGRYVEGALRVDRIGPLLTDALLTTHLVHVQDETSQMAVLALAPGPSDLLLDACAGQGTKTDQIREISPETRIVAMDVDREKLRTIRATAFLTQADAAKNPFKKGCFDSILLDAPCSSLGIVRKHPEIKWRRKEADIMRHGAMQREMVRALSASLKSGGRLVYSVCSFEPEETSDVVDEFVKVGSLVLEKALPAAAEAPWFLSLPHVTGMDGFFIARLRKP
jgi:16S rRNA (cytosine967-C5)-methyltransferase